MKTYRPKILFILKYRNTYWGDEYSYCGDFHTNHHNDNKILLSSGLVNSATFVCEALNKFAHHTVEASIVHVIDNNDIDREVSKFRPDIVIIEAYWVVPEKFEILCKLHPKVKWIVRNHSEMPFAAQEGIIMDWTLRYLEYPNVFVSGNSIRSYNDMSILVDAAYPKEAKHVILLPNIYPNEHERPVKNKQEDEFIDVACFGAIRPLKNHLIQAVAAVRFAKLIDKRLRFHINGSRLEGGVVSNQILRNLKLLFNKLPNAELVEHAWYPHDVFLEVLKTMDIGMQVSLSETFNIVSADMVHVGLPVVTSKESLWAPSSIFVDPTDTTDIINKMLELWEFRTESFHQEACQYSLNEYSFASLSQWIKEIKELTELHHHHHC